MVLNPKHSEYVGQGLVSFSYDDGCMNNYTLGIPLHEQYNIPATFNIITSIVNGSEQQAIEVSHLDYFGLPVTSDQIKEMSDLGYEMASHSHTHPNPNAEGKFLNNLTESELRFEYSESNRLLRQWGVPRVEGFVIPGSKYSSLVSNVSKEYYKYLRSMGDQSLIPSPPLDSYNLPSIYIAGTSSFEFMKSKIDQAISEKRWLIFMMHGLTSRTGSVEGYTFSTGRLEQVFQYINSIPREQLLPINKQDAFRFVTGLGDYSVNRIDLSFDGVKLNATGFDEFDVAVPISRGFAPKISILDGNVSLINNNDGTFLINGSGNIKVEDSNDSTVFSQIYVEGNRNVLKFKIGNSNENIPLSPSLVDNNKIGLYANGSTNYIPLVDVTDINASNIRVFTKGKIKALRK